MYILKHEQRMVDEMDMIRKVGIGLIAAAMALQSTSIVSSAQETEKPNTQDHETDRVIVTLAKGESSEALDGEMVSTLDVSDSEELVTMQVPDGISVDDYVKELEKDSSIKTVEPDYLITTTAVPNDPYYSFQYHHDVLNMESAWKKTQGSSDVVVAVLDDGFDLDHPELRNQWETAYWTASRMSEEDHGTHVAGIIGASANNNTYGSGVAPHTELMPIDVFEGEFAYTSDVIEAIYLAADAGADVINMSLGSYNYSAYYNAAIQYAHQRGAVIVAASGNDDSPFPHYPSGYDNVIAVGATDEDDWITGFSNYGYDQDIVAPGENIWSTLMRGSFGAMSGTSMASPVVAGVAALILANEPHLTNIEVEKRLYDTAVDLGNPGKDVLYGNGRVDAAAALLISDTDQPFKPTDRISGSSRYMTAIAISQEGWKSAESVVLATAADFPDALAGGPLAFQEDAPILLTKTGALTPETKQEIQRLGAKKVIVLGRAGAISAEVEAELKRMNLTVERIGGQTRFDTAALIAEKLNSDKAVVANGLNFPDVLSVSSYAAKNGIPILLTRTDRLPEETKAALEDKTSSYVIGSTGAVSDGVFKTLPKPTRLGGKDRYETGYVVATSLALGTDKAYIATGMNFPDALAGSVLAAKNDAPILLVRPAAIPDATNRQLSAYDSFSIFGGTGAVSDGVKTLLDEALKQ